MKEIIHGLKMKAKRNKKLLYFLGGLALVGVISGSLFLTFIDSVDQELVKEYVMSFKNSIDSGTLNYIEAFKNTFFSNFIYSLMIFILGISIIGIPVIITLYFIKSFMIGFSISSFVFSYGIKGSILSIFYLIPHFINLIFYTILIVFAVKISLLLISSLFGKKEISLKKPVSRYVTYYMIVLVMILFTSLLETFFVPMMLKNLSFLF